MEELAARADSNRVYKKGIPKNQRLPSKSFGIR
jgi:hypothetical protein